MANVSPEILELQKAYASRPFAVRWVDSHFSGTFRFHTLDESYQYVQEQWARISKEVATHRCRSSSLWRSFLETPEGKTPLSYVLLTTDISSYEDTSITPAPQKTDSAPAQIHAFNTRRRYTAHGQRIAWAVLSNGRVAMVDIDRHIDYTLIVSGTPSNQTVLAAYDANATARWDEAEHREAQALRHALYKAANGAPSLTTG